MELARWWRLSTVRRFLDHSHDKDLMMIVKTSMITGILYDLQDSKHDDQCFDNYSTRIFAAQYNNYNKNNCANNRDDLKGRQSNDGTGHHDHHVTTKEAEVLITIINIIER